ncbi:DNA sulfur modification protein DndD [Paenibacillus elgii]
MIFNFVRFENYRPYYGIQQLNLHKQAEDFSPYKQNVTLVGGLNGAGKTSLINSFYICFYGRRMFSKDEYDSIKKGAINRKYFREGGKNSKIELSFSDNTGSYLIEVQFMINHKEEVIEQRKIYVVRGEENREVASAEEEFNDFIDQRIPIDVAPFFIFDAEKIRDLVGSHDQKETIQAIQKIVSLELYKQLHSDLAKIKYDDELSIAKTVKDEEIQTITKNLQDCANELELSRYEEKPDELEIEKLKAEKVTLEHKRRLKLASSSQTKGQINRSIGLIEKELEMIKKTLEHFGRSSLPGMVVAPLIANLQDKIKREQTYVQGSQRNQAAFAPYDKFIHSFLSQVIAPPLSDEQKSQLKDKGKDVWAQMNRVQQVAVEKVNVLHYNALSQNDLQSIYNWKASNTVDIKSLINKKIKLQNEFNQLNAQLNDAPELIDTKEEDDRIAEISVQLGEMNAKIRTRRERITRLADRHNQLKLELSRKTQARNDLGPLEQKMELTKKLINATAEFIERVTVLKAKQLKDEIESILLRLFRKSDLHRVEFDSNQFVLKVFDEDNNEIDLNSRSEGEKQLIALSMIWALTKVSGTNFPFVIDTPLARLDSIHRSRLVDHFFTNLSDQVIILTTDTEITKDFLEDIKPHVQQSYVLEYKDEENATSVREGYFEFV